MGVSKLKMGDLAKGRMLRSVLPPHGSRLAKSDKTNAVPREAPPALRRLRPMQKTPSPWASSRG